MSRPTAASSALEDDIERRLLNWARWKVSGGQWLSIGQLERFGRGFAFGTDRYRSGYRETVIPVLSGEALETDAAVEALAPSKRDAIRGWYLAVLPSGARMRVPWTQADLALAMGYPVRSFARLLAGARRTVAEAIAARRCSRGRAAASMR